MRSRVQSMPSVVAQYNRWYEFLAKVAFFIGEKGRCIIGVWALPTGESGLLIRAILTRGARAEPAE